jgi:hypothetical protein
MKRILPTTVLFAMIAILSNLAMAQTFTYPVNGQQGFNLTEKTRGGLHISYNLGQFSLNTINYRGEDMSEITISGVCLPNAEGCPDLPVESRMLAIPHGATATLNVVHFETEIIRDVNIAPALRIQAMNEEPERNYVKDMNVYGRNAYYPAEPFAMGTSYIRGVDAVTVAISPFQYNPVTRELVVYTNVELSVSFEGGTGQFGDNRLRSPYWDPILAAELMNYDQLPAIDYEARMQQWLRDGAEGAEYLIITPNNDAWAEYANQLRDYRTRQGILTKVVRLDEMPATTTDEMKAWFHNAYNTWEIAPVAVCLLGDHGTDMSQYIPAETLFHSESYGDYITDNGYADASGDNLPDMVFSRLVAQDASELPVFVGKQIEYEYTNPNMDYNFYDKPITSCGWEPRMWSALGAEIPGGYLRNQGYHPRRINSISNGEPGPTPGESWSNWSDTWPIVNYFGPEGTGYIPATPYELGGWTGGTAAQIVQAVNEGAFWLHNDGHGNVTFMGTPFMENSDVAQTTNVGKLPFVIMSNCSTGEFNASIDCFTEAWMRHTYNGNNAGAVGVISATQVSYNAVNELLYWGMYDYFEDDFMPTYGTDVENSGSWMPAFGNVAGKYFLSQTSWESNGPIKEKTFNLFTAHCDAFLRIYTQVPQETSAFHPESIITSQGEITVMAPVGCVICLSKANQEGGVDILAVATATGTYQNITFEPQMAATEIKIVVTGQNYLRYEGIMEVVSPEGAYLVVEDYTPHAAPVNQQTNLGMSFRNLGNMASSGMTTINLSTSDERLNIINGTATMETIVPNETINLESAFSFIIADGVQDGTEFPFEVTMSCGDKTWTGYGVITAQQAAFEYLGMSWSGGFVPGETLTVTATFKNTGHYEAVGAVAQIASTSPYVSFENETYEIGVVGINEEVECSINVSISPDCPETESIPLLFSINANGNVSTEAPALLRNTCNLTFNLYSSWSTGWNDNILVVDFSDGTPTMGLYLEQGQYSHSFIVPIGEGVHVTLSWVSGSYTEKCSFNVEYENGVVLYQGTNLHAGLLYEFDMNCDDQFSPLNVAVSAEPAEGGVVTGGGAYEPGETCTITAIANETYTFVNWTENDVVVSTNPTYSFTVMANHDFVAHFMPPLAITVSPNIEEGGMVTGEGLYGYGETCTLTASVNENYVFDSWTKDGVVVSYFSTYTFTVTEDVNYVANFELVDNGIIIGDAVSESNNLPSISDWYSKFSLSQQIYTADEIGSACMITGVAFFNTGNQNVLSYTIYMKHTDKNSFINGNDWISVVESDEVFNGDFVMAAGNWTYIDFDRPFYYDGSSNLALIVDENYYSSNGMKCRVFNTGEYQSIRMSSSQINYDPTNLSGYYGSRGLEKNQIVFTQLMPSTDPVTVTVIANPVEAGIVSGSGAYYLGDTCNVTATSNEGYCFAHWTKNGKVVSSDADYSFVVVGESVMTAHFVPEGNIDFFDDNVKAICVANWDTNGDGELSYVEAASVRNIGTVFRENTTITSFEELQYFIGLTSIYNYAFYNCISLTGSLTIPTSITLIGNSAFRGCSGLTSLTIGNSVTLIDGYAFYGCSGLTEVRYLGDLAEWCNIQFGGNIYYSNPLFCAHKLFINNELVTNLVIPESVTELKPYVFCGASCLTSLTIPNTVTSIGNYAFYDCWRLTGSLTIPNSVTSIGSAAFARCWGFTGALTIPNSVTSIGSSAFSGCRSFTGSLIIPDSVTSIGGSAFYGCSGLTGSLIIPNSVTSIGGSAFSGCSGMTGSLIIPNSVTLIGAEAFRNCSGFTGSLTIPNSVTSMGYRVFQGCSGLTGSLTISSSLTSISLSAFEGCSSLTGTLTIPSSITSIDNNAFYGCSGLTEMIIFAEMPPTMGTSVLSGISIDIPVYVPCESVGAYQNAQGWDSFSNIIGMCSSGTITVSSVPTEGGEVTGAGVYEPGTLCTVIASPNEGYTFVCWKENGIVVSTQIEYTFTVSIDRNLVALFVTDGNIVFADANVKAICVATWDTNGDGELSYAEAAMVTTLGSLFRYNNEITSFEELQYFVSLTTIDNYAFGDCTNLAGSLIIPNSVTTIGQEAFEGCSGLTGSLIIPNSVTEIVYGAFLGCSGLTSLTIGNSITSIGNCAFRNCSGLASLTIFAETPPTLVSTNAFDNRTLPIYVPCDAVETYQNASTWSWFTNIAGMCSGEIAVTVNPSEGGTATGAGYYEGGETCTLTATANEGYVFNCWTKNGEVVSYLSSFTITMTGGAEFVANFQLMDNGVLIGDGEMSSKYLPSYSRHGYTLSQQIFTIDEIGMNACEIISVAFFNTLQSYPRDFMIYMVSTDKTSFENESDWITVTESDLVFNGTVALNQDCWTTIYFNSPFAYDGTSNLALIIDDNTSSYWYAPDGIKCLTFSTGMNQTLCINADITNNHTNYDPYNPSDYTGLLMSEKNQVIFGITLTTEQQTIAFTQGWNWFSTNVEITLDDLENALVEALPGTTINIKSQTQNVKYQNGRWTGQLTALDMTQMYMISVENDCEISLEGMPIDPSGLTVTINNGANWIAFPYSESMSVTDFFGSFPVNNDQVKSQSQNARYQGNRWAGQLNTLVPGKGYLYISNTPGSRTFTFPVGAK